MRVAITGLGAVSALGADVPALLRGLEEGTAVFAPPRAFDGWGQLAAEVPAGAVGAAPRGWSRSDHLALIAAREALAGLPEPLWRSTGLVVGGTNAGMREMEARLLDSPLALSERIRPRSYLSLAIGSTGARLAQRLRLGGRRSAVCTACSSATHALGVGLGWLRRAARRGRGIERVLVVGADALCRLTLAGFGSLGVLSQDRPRPFDSERSGPVLGEGAGALLLEREDVARARGAQVRAWLLGHGGVAEAHHMTQPRPDGSGALAAFRAALLDAGAGPEQVDYINAHGSATAYNDAMEELAIQGLLGARVGAVPVSSSKSQLGHTLGASGALEAIVSVLALEHGLLPPNPGYRAGSALSVVERAGQRADLSLVLSSSFAFGGNNAVVALGAA